MINKYNHLIIDLDGTIATLNIDWSGWHDATKNLITKYERDAILPSKLTHEITNEYTYRYGHAFRDQLRSITQNIELNTYKDMIPNHQIISLIKSHTSNQKLYLLTSNCKIMAERIISELDIKKYFSIIITRDDVDYIKPDPYPFSLININDYPKDDFVMIGDSTSDSGFAKNVGIDYIDVATLA